MEQCRPAGSHAKGSCENWSRAFGSSIFAGCKVWRSIVRFRARTNRQNRESNSWRHPNTNKRYFGEFQRIIETAGASMDLVPQTTVYLKDVADYSAINEAYS